MSKTPVSILQELMIKRNTLPSFELLGNSEGIGTHSPTFHYKVTAGPVDAIGRAHSKKDAKHEAARLVLEKLANIGLYSPEHTDTSSPVHSLISTPLSPQSIQLNAVGALQALCTEKNIPQPEFELISDIGPAHSRQFTIECKVSTMMVSATDLTKKKAKQIAAQKMLHRLMDTLPEEIEVMSAELDIALASPIMKAREEIIKTYVELSLMNKKKINWGMKISDYPKALKNIMEEKDFKATDIWEDLSSENVGNLQDVLNKFELHYCLDFYMQDKMFIATLTIDSDPEFICAGDVGTKEDSLHSAIQKIYEFLRIMIK